MNDVRYPRVGTILRTDRGELVVSAISERSAPPNHDKRQLQQMEAGAFFYESVGPDVRVGMHRQDGGTYDWPIGHANESGATRQARAALQQAAVSAEEASQ